MSVKISAVVITFNEEKNIERCLLSLQGVVDEIVVVDSFSTDKTEEICKKFTVRFIQNAFEGHIQQKNYAIAAAENEWILSLDADEALTDTLKNSILTAKENPQFKAYKFNRSTNYCGHWVKYCGWYPDTKTRMVDRNFAKWQGSNPHDRLDLIGSGEIGFLKGDLLHFSYYTEQDHLKQIEFFGNIAARELFSKGEKSGQLKIAVKVVAQFIKSYFIKLGILDGKTGFTISRLSAFATYRKYKILLNLYRQK